MLHDHCARLPPFSGQLIYVAAREVARMPWLDLNTPTELVFQWGWLLVTRGNGVVYGLVVLVFLLGIFVRLPGAKRDLQAVEDSTTAPDSGGVGGGSS
jgi:hypothetical protein